MADSEISTTLPFVTRRDLMMGTIAAAAIWPPCRGVAATTQGFRLPVSFDPAWLLWREWKAAHLKTGALCWKQQQLETWLANRVGFPAAAIDLPDKEVEINVAVPFENEALPDDDPDLADLSTQAEVALAAQQARWDSEDKRIGYSAAKREELAAAQKEQELLAALMASPATTLAGVAGKLDAVLREGESCEGCTEFPWPYIRSALFDLERIRRGGNRA